MKKLISILIILLLPVCAFADVDLTAMSTDDLVTLRNDIDLELAARTGQVTKQVIEMDGVYVTLDSAAIGTVKDGSRAVVVYVRISNATDEDLLFSSAFTVQASLDGILLEPLRTSFDSVTLNDGSMIDPSVSYYASVRPGAVNLQLALAFRLPGAAEGKLTVDFRRNWVMNGYGGYFNIVI